ncbi:class I SAM-dependent methyltransferase [Rhodocytophaga rosea]|uniref:Class I SAM-dependent methyltransferase n=1 Tax=Rhodocytophaga rosea TaxID=2704465 RepID=A0A6C0GCE1_9BACT|nr:class I SAM-dependent methyltransferase [Rhodocytophaga rosea]QHT65626.1 class I SAM-dependent methyltransferase [Rhodocytophaga rosea]
MNEKITEELQKFYDQNLANFGQTAKGVGWKNEEAQLVRFEQLAKLLSNKLSFHVNDLGCGTGAFVDYLYANHFSSFAYIGYDILPEMIKIAAAAYQKNQQCRFVHISDPLAMEEADYTVSSGIFNVKNSLSNEKWLEHMMHTIHAMNANSRKGFAFNALTSYADRDKMQDYLYYADPLYLFDYCKKNFSKNVALLHDYNQYDFTIIVRK